MTKFYYLVALAILLLPASLIAQEKISAKPVSLNSAPSLSHIFKKYALFTINTTGVAQYVKEGAARGDIRLLLDLPGYASFPIYMHEHDILGNDYKLVVGSPEGRQEFPKPACMTYEGELLNETNSSVSLTITNDLIYGMLNGSRKYFIEPLRYFNQQAGDNIYVVYETKDVIPNSGISCGVSEIAHRKITNSSARVEGTAVGSCKLVEVAIASDHTMMQRYTTTTRVQEHNIAVMNTMVGLYSNAQIGSQYLEFKINGQYVSTVEANNSYSPAYTGNDATILLPRFTTWGQAGNFGFAYDMAVVWTTKDITDGGGYNGVIGLAYVGTVCTIYKYQILEDMLGLDGAQLGALAAHETGHNFDANHDGGSGYIMQPSLGSPAPTDFSATSLSEMDAYISVDGGCLGACNTITPIAQFNASNTSICTGSNITFTDYSVGQVTGVSWTFQDGTPASSTNRSQTVTYSTPGYKLVTLTATSANGTNSISKSIFVSNSTNSSAGCRTAYAGSGSDYGILQSFMLQDLRYSPSALYAGNIYNNNTCNNITVLRENTTYTAAATIGYSPYTWTNKFQLFIDYNNDGDFADANEAVYTSPVCVYDGTTFTFTTPATVPLKDVYLRMRTVTITCSSTNTNGCTVPNNSNTQDFSVYFSSSIILPTLLTSFDGHYSNGKNQLNWQTETEVNTDQFIVERSINGSNYTEIGQVRARGLTGTRFNNYQLTDELLNAQTVNRFFYRLKIVDRDGAYKYSKLVITNRPTGGDVHLIVYPNPVSRNTTLQIAKVNNNMSLIEVYNSMGQRVYAKRMTASLYNESVEVPANWSPGIYMVRVTDSKETWSRAVLIK
jgi:PKD repeat protein